MEAAAGLVKTQKSSKTVSGSNTELILLLESEQMANGVMHWLNRASNLHYKAKIFIYLGTSNSEDLLLVQPHAALALFVLPDLYALNPIEDDHRNGFGLTPIGR